MWPFKKGPSLEQRVDAWAKTLKEEIARVEIESKSNYRALEKSVAQWSDSVTNLSEAVDVEQGKARERLDRLEPLNEAAEKHLKDITALRTDMREAAKGFHEAVTALNSRVAALEALAKAAGESAGAAWDERFAETAAGLRAEFVGLKDVVNANQLATAKIGHDYGTVQNNILALQSMLESVEGRVVALETAQKRLAAVPEPPPDPETPGEDAGDGG